MENKYAKMASEFVKKSFKNLGNEDGYEEFVLPLVNGIVVRFYWEGDGFHIGIYDHQHSVYMNGVDEKNLNECLPYVEKAVEDFYLDYVGDCVNSHNTISLPGCPGLYWDKRKHQYYIQRYDRQKGGWKEWVDAWVFACEQAKNGRFWMGE